MNRKIISILTAAILFTGILSACNKSDTSGVSPVTMPDASQMEAQTPVIEDEKATDPSAVAEAENPGNTNDELCKMAQDYYEKHNNFRPPIAEAEDNGDGRILIHLYEQMPDHTATSAWYVIDPKTGKGEDMIFEGEKIDLTEVAK